MQRQDVIGGTLYLLVSQVIFLITGYIIQIGLGRYLGPSGYGIYSIIIYISMALVVILSTGIPQAVSKYISENECQKNSVLTTGFILLLPSTIIISISLFFCSGWLATIFNDYSLKRYIELISILIPPYAILYLMIGYYNGIMDYRMQSLLYILYNISKPIMIFIFVLMGYSVWGALLGFSVSSIIPVFISLYFIIIPDLLRSNRFPLKKILNFSIPIIIFYFTINLIMSMDLFFVKRILITDEFPGFYSAASMVARVPYFLIAAATTALFPAISSSMSDSLRLREYIRESLRYSLLFLLPITAMVVGSSTQLVVLLYSDAYKAAGYPLEMLTIGMSIFSIFTLLATILSGCGRPRIAMILSLIILMADIPLNLLMVPVWGMVGAAIATTVSSAIGLILAALYVYKLQGTLTPIDSTVKIFFASLMLYAAIYYLGLNGGYLLLGYAVVGALYLPLLLLLGELKPKDIERFKRIMRKQNRSE